MRRIGQVKLLIGLSILASGMVFLGSSSGQPEILNNRYCGNLVCANEPQTVIGNCSCDFTGAEDVWWACMAPSDFKCRIPTPWVNPCFGVCKENGKGCFLLFKECDATLP